MKVVEKAIMKDGVKIQIEDWSEDYTCHKKNDTIAAYPKTKSGQIYRAECTFETTEKAASAFCKLKNGVEPLESFPFTTKKVGKDIPFKDYWCW